MKKLLCMILILCMSFSLVGCSNILGSAVFLCLVATGNDRAAKDGIFEFVSEKEEDLLIAVKARDFSAFENNGVIKEITAGKTVVEFYCGGAGFGSGTSYVGFYYTPDNDMTALWCAPSSPDLLNPSGNGFEWREPDGDNRYYTEHICGDFYYYEASF